QHQQITIAAALSEHKQPDQRARSGGEQVYDHLEVTVTRRLSHGYSFTASYIWSSNINRTTREDEFDDFLVRTPSNNSAPHNLNVNFIYCFVRLKLMGRAAEASCVHQRQ